MASTTETGHAKNFANFQQLHTVCISFGTVYNPSKAALKTASQITLIASAQNVTDNLNQKQAQYTDFVNQREQLFKPLSKLITRILNSLKSSDVSDLKIEDIKTITRKLTGQRATSKSNSETLIEKKDTNQISVSQMSYDSRIDNFAKLLSLLTSEVSYSPNETDLKLTTLTQMLSNMKTSNTSVVKATVELNKARIERNKIFYQESKGLVEVAKDIKTYIKTIYSPTSLEYKQVSKLQFKTYSN